MKSLLRILFVLGIILSVATMSYAAQVIVFDPISDYEFRTDSGPFVVAAGATFYEPVTNIVDYDLFVGGLPAGVSASVQKVSPFRIAVTLRQTGSVSLGEYTITLTAKHHPSKVTVTANMRIRMINCTKNASIAFDNLEQIKVLQLTPDPEKGWYSIPIGVVDQDAEPLILDVTGAVNNALGYASYTQTENKPGRIAGTLRLKMYKAGELTINLVARDMRSNQGLPSNRAIAQLHFIVQ